MKEFKEQIVEKIIETSHEQKIVSLKAVAASLGIKHITRQDTVDIQKAVAQRLEGYHAVQMMDAPHASLFQSLTWIEDGVEFDDRTPVERVDSFRSWLSSVGLSQSECAGRFGIPLRTVQNWANGVNSAPDYVVRLMQEAADAGALVKAAVVARALECSADDIALSDLRRFERCGYLTENETRSGHTVIWYLDSEDRTACFDTHDLRFLSDDEIDDELC